MSGLRGAGGEVTCSAGLCGSDLAMSTLGSPKHSPCPQAAGGRSRETSTPMYSRLVLCKTYR